MSVIHALIVDCKNDHSHCFAKHSFDWSELASHLGSFSLSAYLPWFPSLLLMEPTQLVEERFTTQALRL